MRIARLGFLLLATGCLFAAMALQTLATVPGMYGVCFGPYTNFPVQSPPPGPPDFVPTSKIESLLSVVRPHTSWIRTFGAESGLEEIPEVAHGMGLNVAMGVHLGTDLSANENQIANLIEKAVEGFVDIAVVGNETQVWGKLTEGQLVSYLQDVRSRLDDAGLMHIPVTTAEPFGTHANSQPGSIFNPDGSLKKNNIIANCDEVFLNIYPFYESGIRVTEAVSKLEEMYWAAVDSIEAAFPGKGDLVSISETGWPSEGDKPMTGGHPSLDNATKYFYGSVQWARENEIKLFNFEAFDEDWKTPPEYEEHFGIWQADETLKLELPADLDFDCDVDLSDLMITQRCGAGCDMEVWREHFGAGRPGDFDLEGDVDIADLMAIQRDGSAQDLEAWRDGFSGGGVSAVAAVPEPGAGVLVSLAVIGLIHRRGRGGLPAGR